jgi:hypothetical protein
VDRTEDGVLISDGRCHVRLTRNGQPLELGIPTIIDLRAGPFQGLIREILVDYGQFKTQLGALYDSLLGSAALVSYDGFDLQLTGNGVGDVGVRVRAIQHVPLIELTFEFHIDQTYLPAIIRQANLEFPPPYRQL